MWLKLDVSSSKLELTVGSSNLRLLVFEMLTADEIRCCSSVTAWVNMGQLKASAEETRRAGFFGTALVPEALR